MRVYKHPEIEDWVIAEKTGTRIELDKIVLPPDIGEARIVLEGLLDEAIARKTSMEPSPPEPDALDEQAELLPGFEALAEKAAAEIAWLEETIPQIDAMTLEELRAVLKRLARENLEALRAWRYVLRRLA